MKKVAIPQGEETYILCRTAGRKEKEKAIRNRFSTSMETALKGLEKAIVTGRLKDRNKMERRLGKIQARHPQVSDLYDLDLRETAEGVRLFWQIKQDRRNWREAREGAYLLRTNLTADSAEELWSKYMQLTEAEERAFSQALVSPVGAARKSSHYGRVPRLRPVGYPETSAQAPNSGGAKAIGKWCR